MQRKIRVGVVDDHPLYRDGVIFALESEADMEIIAQGETAGDAYQIALDQSPDVLLLDMNMPGGGINAVSKIALRCPSTKTLVLTVVDDEDEVRSALRKGAAQLIMSRGAEETILRDATGMFPELSEREAQILLLIHRGLSNRHIGDELGLTEKTVKGYVTSIMEKLHVRNRVEAAMVAAERTSTRKQ
jgi:DNA-binding NarL/FixJ family response regulator